MKEFTLNFRPSKAQQEVLSDRHRFKTVSAGRRLGKSKLARNFLIQYALMYPGSENWLVSSTEKQGKTNHWEEFKKDIPDGLCVFLEGQLTIKFPNNSRIVIVGQSLPDNLRGIGLMSAVCDEYQDFYFDTFDVVLRPALADFLAPCLFIGTPKGKRNPLFERMIRDSKFYDKYDGDEYRTMDDKKLSPADDYRTWEFKSIDNPYLPEDEIQAAKETLTPEQFRQEWEATIENYTGLIYPEFVPVEHTRPIKSEEISGGRIYVGIDTGRTYACGFISVHQDKMYFFDLIYEQDTTAEIISMKIKRTLLDYGIDINKVSFIIDSASQVKKEFVSYGIFVQDAAKNVLGQIDQTKTMLMRKQIVIDSVNCRPLINELDTYVWSKTLTRSKDRQPDIHCDDHAIQAGLHYICANLRLVRQKKEIIEPELAYKSSVDWLTKLIRDKHAYADEHRLTYIKGVPFRDGKPYIRGVQDRNPHEYSVTGY